MTPLFGTCTMEVGFTPTQTVLVTFRDACGMVLSEPVLGHAEFVPELTTYITLGCAELANTGCDPGSNAMVVTAPLMIGTNALTVSLLVLAVKSTPEEGGNASETEPTPRPVTPVVVSPDTSICVVLPSPLGLLLTT